MDWNESHLLIAKTFVNIMVLYTRICTGVRGGRGDYLVFAGITQGCQHDSLGCGRWMEGGRRDRLSTFDACLRCDLNLIEAEWYMRQLTHWGRAMHICVVNLTTIGSANGAKP